MTSDDNRRLGLLISGAFGGIGILGGLFVLHACASARDEAREAAPAIASAFPAPSSTPPGSCTVTPCTPPLQPASAAPSAPALHVKFLGVDGFLLEHGGEAVLTAPLFTRPSLLEVSTGAAVRSDAALVARSLPAASKTELRAVVSGHAHYDHLLDVPAVMAVAPSATFYGNRSARNLLAAYAPDRGERCARAVAQAITIARSRVVALDDPKVSAVDYTNCPAERPDGAPSQGRWVRVPGAHVRVLAVCSAHPDQIGPIHFGPGLVADEQCTPPTDMNAWREGTTLAYLIDFLDEVTDAPVYRIFFHDAPTNEPIGHIPPAFLADKRVDLALFCVGNYDHVDDASPVKAITALAPRYVLGGHWEEFFSPAGTTPQPILFLDVAAWRTKARTALPPAGEPLPLVQNGIALLERAVLPQPGDAFEISP